MKIIAKHKPLSGVIITESYKENELNYRRFTATIRGFRNWKLFEGITKNDTFEKVINKAEEIRNKIDNKDEEIFLSKNNLIK